MVLVETMRSHMVASNYIWLDSAGEEDMSSPRIALIAAKWTDSWYLSMAVGCKLSYSVT